MTDGRISATVFGALSRVGWFAVGVLGSLVARLLPLAIVVVALAAFGAVILVLVPLLSPLGISDQMIAAVAGAGVLVGLWVIGLRLLTDR